MKLRKLAAALTAAAIAVTTAVVCPITTVAVEANAELPDGITYSETDHPFFVLPDKDFVLESVPGAAGSTSATINATLLSDNGWSDGEIGYNSTSGWIQSSYDSTASHAGKNAPFTFEIGKATDYELKDFSVGSDGSMSIKWDEYSNGVIAINKITFSNGYVYYPVSSDYIGYAAKDRDFIVEKVKGAVGSTSATITATLIAENGWSNGDVGYNATSGWIQDQNPYDSTASHSAKNALITFTEGVAADYPLKDLSIGSDGSTTIKWAEYSNGIIVINKITFSNGYVLDVAALEAKNYNITIAPDVKNGTVTVDKTEAAKDDTVTLTVTPADGYKYAVADWTIAPASVQLAAVEGAADKYTFTMPEEDVTITPVFAPIDYTVTGYTDANGNKVTADKTTANIGNTVTLTVAPAEGYKLEDGSVTATDANGTAVAITDNKITMPAANVTIAAKFIPIEAESVAIDAAVSVLEGGTKQLTATVSPEDALDKKVTWNSDTPGVATVDANGLVTGVKEGTANITAKTANGKVSNMCVVTVTKAEVKTESVTVDPTDVTVTEGETVTVKATITPADTTDTAEWKSADPKIATVENGVIKGVAEGKTTVTVTSGEKSATVNVTVTKKTIPVTSITLDKTTAELTVGDTLTLTATVNPEDATDKTVTWSTSNEKVATVDNGKVTAVGAGEAVITVTGADGKSAECKVTVKEEEKAPEVYTIIDTTAFTADKAMTAPVAMSMDNTNGTKNVRFVQKISAEDAKTHKSYTITVSNGSKEKTYNVDKCYSKIQAVVNGAETTLEAGENYVFVVFTLGNVPADVTITCNGTGWVNLD